jgi:hypothetical protein
MSAVVQLKRPEQNRSARIRARPVGTGEVVRYPYVCREERKTCRRVLSDVALDCRNFVDFRRAGNNEERDSALASVGKFAAQVRRLRHKKRVSEDLPLCGVLAGLLWEVDELRFFLRHREVGEKVYTFYMEKSCFEPLLATLSRMYGKLGSLSETDK